MEIIILSDKMAFNVKTQNMAKIGHCVIIRNKFNMRT